MKIFPNFFIAKYLYSFSFLFTLFLILLRTNNSFINPKNHPTQPSPNHPIFPSYITIYPLQYTLTFSYNSNTKKKKKKRKNHKARPTVLPLNSGNAQKIANSFPPPWNGNELDPTAHHWISRSFFSFFFFLVGLKLFLVALVYLTLACQLLSTPFSIVEKKKKKGTFPRVNVCARVWSSAENTVLR